MMLLLLALGLGFLVAGATMIIRGGALLAARLGLSPLVIGMTVVAFSASSPELVVSLGAVIGGVPDVAVGAVVGSNIFNVLFTLGLAALVAPLVVSNHLLRYGVPLMILVATMFYLMSGDRVISRTEGGVLVACLIAATTAMIYFGRRKGEGEVAPHDLPSPLPVGSSLKREVLLVLGGLVITSLGSHWFVDGAVQLARWMGVSNLVIGLTVVAVGASLPELITTVVASLRGDRDIAVGNVVGSIIFNILGVLGLTAMLAPNGLPIPPVAIAFDIPVMVAVALVCLPIFFTGGEIARWEGALLLIYYLIYAIYLVLAASKDDDLEAFGEVVLWYVIRPTVFSLLICVALAWWRKWKTQRAQSAA